jgi:mannose-1-phosphate guanylyltransferase/phosphomannomutase
VKAVIMAGGEGTRLRPLTATAPKPLLPVANRPMMEHVIDLLRRHGVDDIIVTVAFMANAIRNYFGDGTDLGVRIRYVDEPVPLGTAGSVRNAADLIGDERFLVISGDVITDIDLTSMMKFHEERCALATIGLTPVENPLEFGIVITREDGSIDRFHEKPTWGQVFSDTINTGIYVLEAEVLDHIIPNQAVDFSADVFPALLEQGRPLFGAVGRGYWEDVGTLDAYLRAHTDVLDQMVHLRIPGFQLADGVWVGEGCEISPDAVIDGPAVIGPECTIEAGVHLGAYTVLGSHVRVLHGSSIDRSVVQDNTFVGAGARLRGVVTGRSVSVRSGAHCDEGVVLGDDVVVGSNAAITDGVRIYPGKVVDNGAVVNSSIVWESRGSSSLFGRDGVKGLANVDVSPELATKVALAYATSLRKGSTVVTSRDTSLAARMLKRAMMAGLNAGGVNVLDLEVSATPMTRFLVRTPRAVGGVTLRLSADDPRQVSIRFFDTSGVDISEDVQRKLERLYQREDYRRVLPEEIGDISFPIRALEDYTEELRGIVDPEAIQQRGFKLVLDYGFGPTSTLMPNVLAMLQAEVLAVNPYLSTPGRLRFDPAEATKRVAGLVRASGAHVGALVDADGERLRLVDDEGTVLTDTEAMLAFIELVCDHLLGDRIAVPVNTTSRATELAARHDVTIQPTKMSAAALMAAALERGVGFATDGRGGYILPGFLPAFDACAALVKILDLLARSGRSLSEVRRSLPGVHVAHETLATPWELKGLIMRSLVEGMSATTDHAAPVDPAGDHTEMTLIDGVKVTYTDGRWALAVPDPEAPLTHVWAEAPTSAAARTLAKEWSRRIRRFMR